MLPTSYSKHVSSGHHESPFDCSQPEKRKPINRISCVRVQCLARLSCNSGRCHPRGAMIGKSGEQPCL